MADRRDAPTIEMIAQLVVLMRDEAAPATARADAAMKILACAWTGGDCRPSVSRERIKALGPTAH